MKVFSTLDVLFLRHLLNHISIYSGYENFIKQLHKESISYKEIFRRRALNRFDLYRKSYITNRNKKKANSIGQFYNPFSYLAEMETLKAASKLHPHIIHNTFLEDNHGFLGDFKKKYNFHLIATSHQPVSWWKYTNKNLKCLDSLSMLLTVTSREQEYFDHLIPGRVKLVHHAVDTNFFTVTKKMNHRPNRILFVGNWLRDTAFFERVVSRLLQFSKDMFIDIVYSLDMDISSPLFRLCKYPQVTLHRFISNEDLRDLYNNSRLLFLPLIDCTANSSLLEAMACGLPVVTSDLPGLKDYTNTCNAWYYKNEKDCLEFILETIRNDAELEHRSVAARKYMCNNFSLAAIAAEHAAVYRGFI